MKPNDINELILMVVFATLIGGFAAYIIKKCFET